MIIARVGAEQGIVAGNGVHLIGGVLGIEQSVVGISEVDGFASMAECIYVINDLP